MLASSAQAGWPDDVARSSYFTSWMYGAIEPIEIHGLLESRGELLRRDQVSTAGNFGARFTGDLALAPLRGGQLNLGVEGGVGMGFAFDIQGAAGAKAFLGEATVMGFCRTGRWGAQDNQGGFAVLGGYRLQRNGMVPISEPIFAVEWRAAESFVFRFETMPFGERYWVAYTNGLLEPGLVVREVGISLGIPVQML